MGIGISENKEVKSLKKDALTEAEVSSSSLMDFSSGFHEFEVVVSH